MSKLANLYQNSDGPTGYVAGYCNRLVELIQSLDHQAIADCIARIEQTAESGNTIFCMGNGGSAGVASHFINDLCPNSYVEGKKPIRMLSLTDNVESVTAIANDFGYEDIFLHQLRCLMRQGDLVIALSVSGNSENLVRAVEFALANGGSAIAWTGFDGGRLGKLCSPTVCIPTQSDEYGPVEGIFAHVAHIVSGYLTMKRGKYLGHEMEMMPERSAGGR